MKVKSVTLTEKTINFCVQIAFGIGSIDANPDMFPIFDYCRANGVVPNVTINGYNLTDEIATRLANTCGAVAVSFYGFSGSKKKKVRLRRKKYKNTVR